MTAKDDSPSFPPTIAASLNDQLDALVRLHGMLGSELLGHSLDALSEYGFFIGEDGKVAHANPILRDSMETENVNPLQWLEERLQGDRERAIAAGMHDYVSKPIRPEKIGAALEKAYRLTATMGNN